MRSRSIWSSRTWLGPTAPASPPPPEDAWAVHHDSQLQALRHLAACLERVLVDLPRLGRRASHERAPLLALESALNGAAKLGPGGGSPATVSPDEARALWRCHDAARTLRGQLWALADAPGRERAAWEARITDSLAEAREALAEWEACRG